MAPDAYVHSHSAEETRRLGTELGRLLEGGDVVALSGELGAGKTCLVQGLALGLGVPPEVPVTSPTFTLVKEYVGRVPIHHVDVYRLERVQEVIDLGLDDLVDPDGVLFVEWGDVVTALLPEARLEVELWSRPEDDGRMVVLSADGTAWAERWERLENLTQRWAVRP